jgi:hypothetical protein
MTNENDKVNESAFSRARHWAQERERQRRPVSADELERRLNRDNEQLEERFHLFRPGGQRANHQR